MYSHSELTNKLKDFRLSGMGNHFYELAKRAEKEKLTYEQYLSLLVEKEILTRTSNRTKRLLISSKIPVMKTIEEFNFAPIEGITKTEWNDLASGDFIKNKTNLVFYGLFGVGKTHLATSLLVEFSKKGIPCLFTSTHKLIQDMLIAKENLTLNQLFKKLDRYDVILFDELGYVPQNEDGGNLFFQLISDRSERKSIIITTNLTFSEWDKVFSNKLSSAAAIERVLHKSKVFNLKGPSHRQPENETNKILTRKSS
jgi:DNA replication protein DnaC